MTAVQDRQVVPWLSGVMSAPPTPTVVEGAEVVAQDEGGEVTHVWRDGAWQPLEPASPRRPLLAVAATALATVVALVLLAVAL